MTEVRLTLRAPNHVDHEVQCQSSWNVLKLKEVIQLTHPNKPKVEEQRLIFSGRFILNHETLDQFAKFTTSVVIHLHFPTSSTPKSEPTTNELRHRNNVPQQPQDQQTSQQQQTTGPPQHHQWNNWTPEQIEYLQNYPQYAAMMQQYQTSMAQYMQYYASHQQYYQQQTASASNEQLPTPAENNINNPPANNVDANAQPPAVNPPMNAQGGFDEVGQRDWLDVLFTLFRYGFFLSILYFYSTLYRFLVVTALFVFFYVYQAGAFNVQRRQTNNNNTDDNNNEEIEEPPSIFATAWCFFSTFFTSLIPQLPQ